jgi:hypothetical protein
LAFPALAFPALAAALALALLRLVSHACAVPVALTVSLTVTVPLALAFAALAFAIIADAVAVAIKEILAASAFLGAAAFAGTVAQPQAHLRANTFALAVILGALLSLALAFSFTAAPALRAFGRVTGQAQQQPNHQCPSVHDDAP